MNVSLADWLTLREAADARARSSALAQLVASRLPAVRPLRFLDLATGTGANIRYLSNRLPRPHQWMAVDRDLTLLARLPSGVDARCFELGVLDDRTLFAGQHLVTASALLDLVSQSWLRSLAARCREAGAAVLFALSYDGRSSCWPADDEDEGIRDLFNAHQRASDKGFGRAAGPAASASAIAAFEEAGYTVQRERTDWELLPDEASMQRELIAGWAQAAVEVDAGQERVVRDWLARRLAHVEEGTSRIRVGHEDIAGWIK